MAKKQKARDTYRYKLKKGTMIREYLLVFLLLHYPPPKKEGIE